MLCFGFYAEMDIFDHLFYYKDERMTKKSAACFVEPWIQLNFGRTDFFDREQKKKC